MNPMTKGEFMEFFDSFVLGDCDHNFSFECLSIQKQYFTIALNILPKLNKTSNSCEKMKRKGFCIKCIKDFYYSVLDKKCFKQSLYAEEVKYKRIKQNYEPFKCKSNYFLSHKTKNVFPKFHIVWLLPAKESVKNAKLDSLLQKIRKYVKGVLQAVSVVLTWTIVSNAHQLIFCFWIKVISNQKEKTRPFASLVFIPVSSAYQSHFVKYVKKTMKDSRKTRLLNYAGSNATYLKNM